MPHSIKLSVLILPLTLLSCNPIQQAGNHFQQHRDVKSLTTVVDGVSLGIDTTKVKQILGEPDADFGFDYRYLIDSTGPQGCAVGAVFHIDDAGKIDQKWIGEICE